MISAEEKGAGAARLEEIGLCKDTFGVLDDVFRAFIETNGRPIDEVLSVREKGFYVYEHLSIPYLATVFTFHDYGKDERWINVKLNCNGFVWPRPPSDAVPFPHRRHGCTGWVTLPISDFYPAVFPYMRSIFEHSDGIVMYYALDAKRVDIKFFYDGDRTNVLVAFEMGYPYYEDYIDSQYRQRPT